MAKLESECKPFVPGEDDEMIEDAADNSDNEENKNKLDDIEIEVERSQDGCIHEVFYPKDYKRNVYTGSTNARKYKFTLDPFQQKAVRAIESE